MRQGGAAIDAQGGQSRMAITKLAWGKTLKLAPSAKGYEISLDAIGQSFVQLRVADGDGGTSLPSGSLLTLAEKDAVYRPPIEPDRRKRRQQNS